MSSDPNIEAPAPLSAASRGCPSADGNAGLTPTAPPAPSPELDPRWRPFLWRQTNCPSHTSSWTLPPPDCRLTVSTWRFALSGLRAAPPWLPSPNGVSQESLHLDAAALSPNCAWSEYPARARLPLFSACTSNDTQQTPARKTGYKDNNPIIPSRPCARRPSSQRRLAASMTPPQDLGLREYLTTSGGGLPYGTELAFFAGHWEVLSHPMTPAPSFARTHTGSLATDPVEAPHRPRMPETVCPVAAFPCAEPPS